MSKVSVRRRWVGSLGLLACLVAVPLVSFAQDGGTAAADKAVPTETYPWVIPAGREAAVQSFVGEWWTTPVEGVKVEGVKIDRARLVFSLKVDAQAATLVVAHAEDTNALPPGAKAVTGNKELRLALVCDGCAPAVAKRIGSVAVAWAGRAAAQRDTVWSKPPPPRADPEPGSLGNTPQGRSPEETKFEPSEDDPDAIATREAVLAASAAGDAAAPAAPRPASGSSAKGPSRNIGRWVLMAGLVALLVWLLRSPAESPSEGVAEAQPSDAQPAGEAAPTAPEAAVTTTAGNGPPPSPEVAAEASPPPDEQTKPS